MWIYACECGLELIHSVASNQYAILGYITEVLAPASIESTVAYKIKEIVEAYPYSSDVRTVVRHVQTALFKFAIKLVAMSRSKDKNMSLLLFQAALVNHTRLGLRMANSSNIQSLSYCSKPVKRFVSRCASTHPLIADKLNSLKRKVKTTTVVDSLQDTFSFVVRKIRS